MWLASLATESDVGQHLQVFKLAAGRPDVSHCSAFTQKVACRSSVSTPVQHHSAAGAELWERKQLLLFWLL